MKRSTDRIRTTHTGSLPRPPRILEALRAQADGRAFDRPAFEVELREQVFEIVRRQVEAGIDVGECSKPGFRAYLTERLGGFEARISAGSVPVPSPVDPQGRDARMFPDYYEGVREHSPYAQAVRVAPRVCVGLVRYTGQEALRRDLKNLKDAMAAAGAEEGFVPSSSPVPVDENEHYRSQEDYIAAYGEAMRTEYRAILDAGLLLQIDDPRLVSSWDSRKDMDLRAYRAWMQKRIEHLNHALRDLPEDRIRFHTCYGGPPARAGTRPRLHHPRGRLLVRGRQPAPRARMARREENEAARRQDPHPRSDNPLQRNRGAPRGRRRPHRALGASGRARERSLR
jgi:5-methyltetrahydropteroyltriglutamate--homocysteine methyltransferase